MERTGQEIRQSDPILQKYTPEVKIDCNIANIKSALRSVDPQDWMNYFETLRQHTYNKIRGTENGDLVSLKYEIKALDVVQEKFLQLRQKSS